VSFGCDDDSPDPNPTPAPTLDLVASFQFALSPENWQVVDFSNFSQNATSYSWDFGDGNSSTQESPSHTYAEGGTYSGGSSKTWKLYREGISMSLGPNADNQTWWTGLSNDGSRPCLYEQEWTFNSDGTFNFDDKGGFWGEFGIFNNNDCDANEIEQVCFDVSPESMVNSCGDDISAWGSGSHTYEYDPSAGSLTLNGLGAWIGIPKLGTSGESIVPVSSVTAQAIIEENAGFDVMTIVFDYGDGVAYWPIKYASYSDPSLEPELVADAIAAFSIEKDELTVNFINMSSNSVSYLWDFGDGITSTEAEPTHTYAASGEYEVTLTATDANGNSNSITQLVVVSNASFDASALSTADGKIWRLAGANSYFVGPSSGSSEWWPGPSEEEATGVRACQMDDEFILLDDGTMNIDMKGQVYAEEYMLGGNACAPVEDLIPPYDVFGGGTFSFEFIEGSGDVLGQLKVIGPGAYFGFNKAYNGGELDGVIAPAEEITYDIINWVGTDTKDEITVTVDYASGFWTHVLVSDK